MDNEIPRYTGEGVQTEMRLMNREEVEAMQAQMQRNMLIDMGGAFKGRLVAVLPVTGSLLIERDNLPDVEVMLYTEPTLQ